MAQVMEQGDGRPISNEETGAVLRAAELCNPFLGALGEITLLLRGPVPASIVNWNASCYAPLVRPLLASVVRQYALGGSLEIMALDCGFDHLMGAEARANSRTEGRRLVLGLLPPRGDRILTRYREAVVAGDTPGHLAVVHALRSALFSIPPRLSEASYLLQEGTGAGLAAADVSRLLIGILGREPGDQEAVILP